VNLHANALSCLSKPKPEAMQPVVFDLKPTSMRPMGGMCDATKTFWEHPLAQPERLAFSLPATATTEMLKRLDEQ